MFSTLQSGVSSPYGYDSHNHHPNYHNNNNNNMFKSTSNYHLHNNTVTNHEHHKGSNLAINQLDNTGHNNGGLHKKHELKSHHLSTTNLSKLKPEIFSSSTHLETKSSELNLNKRLSVSSGQHQHQQLMTDTTRQNSPYLTQTNETPSLAREFKEFWSCSRPCGILAIGFGGSLFLSSILGFVFLSEIFVEKNLCGLVHACSSSLLRVCMVSAFVIGSFLAFIGVIIVIYIKKDSTASVIVLSSKYLENYEEKKQPQPQPQQQHFHHIQQHQNESLPLKKEDTIDMNEYNFERTDSLLNRNEHVLVCMSSQKTT